MNIAKFSWTSRCGEILSPSWYLALEWKPQDIWIGLFWKKNDGKAYNQYSQHVSSSPVINITTVDVWICVIPMLPLHWSREWKSFEKDEDADC